MTDVPFYERSHRDRNPEMWDKWAPKLKSLGFKVPVNHFEPCIYPASADGVYFAFADLQHVGMNYWWADPGACFIAARDFTLAVVGRIEHTPFEYAQMIDPRYHVLHTYAIPPDRNWPRLVREHVLGRGFWAIILRDDLDMPIESAASPPNQGATLILQDGAMEKKKTYQGDEIEVTEAMIEAGFEASRLYDRDDPKDWELVAVYRAMEAARRQGKTGSDSVPEQSISGK